jgi:hypothetical protein
MRTRESIGPVVSRETRHVSREHATHTTASLDADSRDGPKSRPLLLVDVDGVISLFGYDHAAPPAGRYQLVDGIAHYLSATAGEHLRRLADQFELAWCTGWEEKANDYLPRALDLPGPLPHVVFDPAGRPAQAHWKLDGIDRHVEPSRPLAWLDDAHDEGCQMWASARLGPTLLVTTDPAVGITDREVDELLAWARRLR